MLSVPVSPLPFDTFLLLAALWGSFGLIVLSIGLSAGLVANRLLRDRRARLSARRRGEVAAFIRHLLNTKIPAPLLEQTPFAPQDLPAAFDSALATIRTIKGSEATRLVSLLDGWGMRAHITKLLEDGTRPQKIRALTYLAQCRDEESLRQIIDTSRNTDPYVQLAALRALSRRGDAEDLGIVLDHMKEAGQRNTLVLTEILTSFGTPALPTLFTLAASDAPDPMRLAAITALGTIGSREAVPSLLEIAARNETGAELRARALQSLGRIRDERATDAVLTGLEAAEAPIRVQAARAAGRLTLARALPLLTRLLEDPVWWVRYRAAEALLAFGRRGRVLLETYEPPEEGDLNIAAQVLRERRG